MVGASFGLQSFTQTRYDLQDKKIRQASSYYVDHPLPLHPAQLSQEEALGLDKSKKTFDIREEYYVRVARSLTEARLRRRAEIECDG